MSAAVSWTIEYIWVAAPPPNQAPIASFTQTCAGLTCTFDDTSADGDGTIASRSWSFGGTADPQEHTFPSSGTYTVTLNVTDDDGAPSTASAQVTVTAPPPNQAPIASFTHLCTGLTCTFDDTSTDGDGTIASRSWSFGGTA